MFSLNNKKKRKVIILFLIIFSIIIFSGFIIAEQNTRQVSSRTDQSCISVTLNHEDQSYIKVDVLGINLKIDISMIYDKVCFLSKKIYDISSFVEN